MSEQYLTLCSVDGWRKGERYYALVPNREMDAVNRLRADDPVWGKERGPTTLHWSHKINPDCHLRVRDKFKVWVEPKPRNPDS